MRAQDDPPVIWAIVFVAITFYMPIQREGGKRQVRNDETTVRGRYSEAWVKRGGRHARNRKHQADITEAVQQKNRLQGIDKWTCAQHRVNVPDEDQSPG